MIDPEWIGVGLIVSTDDVDTDRMLEYWRWLIPDSCRPLFATALGDLFLLGPEGQVMWLDLGIGELNTVAATEAEFRRAALQSDNLALWFGARLVDQLRAQGKLLGAGECCSYLLPPLLGGEYHPDNFRVYDLMTHFRIWGPLHEKLSNLPDGTTIEFETGDSQ